jgi:hypothetical protein
MKSSNLIRIDQVSTHYHVDASFIYSLNELGHVALIVEKDESYVLEEQLKSLESLIFFHTDLEINVEGVDAIAHLLKKIEALQTELLAAKNKLYVYVKN